MCLYFLFNGKKINDVFNFIKSQLFFLRIEKKSFFGIEMYQLISQAKIVINFHLTGESKDALNMRVFEVTGVGSCLLTDRRIGIEKYFKINKEIMIFNSLEDAIKKINYLLSNSSLLKKISINGKKKTLEKYNIDQQINIFKNFFNKAIK